MPTSNEFVELYKTFSDAELIAIIDNARDYQPAAVEAATLELQSRSLSEEAIDEVRVNLRIIQMEKPLEKIRNAEKRLKATGQNLFETLNPIQSELPSTEKTIRLIVIVFSGIFLYDIIKNFSMHVAFAKDFSRFPFSTILYFLPIILLPLAIANFWKRRNIGWRLLAIYITFTGSFVLLNLIQSLLRNPTGSPFDMVIGPPSFTALIIQLSFCSGVLYLLCRQNMRERFSITEKQMFLTILITGLFSFFTIYAL